MNYFGIPPRIHSLSQTTRCKLAMDAQSTRSFYIHFDSIIAKLGLEQGGSEVSGAAKTNFQFRVLTPL